MTDTRKKKEGRKGIRNADQALSVRREHADRIVGSPSWSSINYNRSTPEDLKLSQTGSSQLPPPFRGLHSPGVRKHCEIIFACYFRKSSIRKHGGAGIFEGLIYVMIFRSYLPYKTTPRLRQRAG